MSPTDVLDLSLGVQTALGGGYLAYITAYAGMRRDHGAEDVIVPPLDRETPVCD